MRGIVASLMLSHVVCHAARRSCNNNTTITTHLVHSLPFRAAKQLALFEITSAAYLCVFIKRAIGESILQESMEYPEYHITPSHKTGNKILALPWKYVQKHRISEKIWLQSYQSLWLTDRLLTAILNELINYLDSSSPLFVAAQRNVNWMCNGGWMLLTDLHEFCETWLGDLMAQATVISSSS